MPVVNVARPEAEIRFVRSTEGRGRHQALLWCGAQTPSSRSPPKVDRLLELFHSRRCAASGSWRSAVSVAMKKYPLVAK
jgi:hypothetical protein